MNCPICLKPVNDGATSCPNCGFAFPQTASNVNAAPNYNQGFNQGFNQAPNQGFNQGYNPAPNYNPMPNQPQKKGLSTGAVVGICVGGVAIIAVLLLYFVLFNKKPNIDGKYSSTLFSSLGAEFTLELDDGNFTMTVSGYGQHETVSGKYKLKDDVLELTVDSESINFTYNKKDKSITIPSEYMGMELVLTKE